MRTILGMSLATALLTLLSMNAGAQQYDAGHSLEADQHDERAEGAPGTCQGERARTLAGSCRSSRSDDRRQAARLQRLPRPAVAAHVGPRPVGGAAVLASYLTDRADQADGPAFIVHAGDHVGASPPDSALLQDEPSIGVLNMLANKWCTFGLQRKLPDFRSPSRRRAATSSARSATTSSTRARRSCCAC